MFWGTSLSIINELSFNVYFSINKFFFFIFYILINI